MTESDRQSIQKFYENWFSAMEDADVEGSLSLLDDDFYFKGPRQPSVQDEDTLRSFLKKFHQSFTETVEWKIDDIHVFESHAVVRILEKVIMVSKETGDTTKIEGVHFSLLTEK